MTAPRAVDHLSCHYQHNQSRYSLPRADFLHFSASLSLGGTSNGSSSVLVPDGSRQASLPRNFKATTFMVCQVREALIGQVHRLRLESKGKVWDLAPPKYCPPLAKSLWIGHQQRPAYARVSSRSPVRVKPRLVSTHHGVNLSHTAAAKASSMKSNPGRSPHQPGQSLHRY